MIFDFRALTNIAIQNITAGSVIMGQTVARSELANIGFSSKSCGSTIATGKFVVQFTPSSGLLLIFS